MICKIINRNCYASISVTFRRFFSASVKTSSRRAGLFNLSDMTSPEKEYICRIKEFIPQLTSALHKGQCGRIGIIGGSLEYTGAPYFAAISALKLGADLVHVFCCREAASVIKSYSPELIVHPLLDDENALEKIVPWLDRLHTIVIGPGLGREEGTLQTVGKIITHCKTGMKSTALPLVIDADGLHLITQETDLILNYPGPVILTPNIAEYSRLCQKLSVNPDDISKVTGKLNAVIVQKGESDIICNGIHSDKLKLPKENILISCNVEGSCRRCGGQGDVLSGCISVFIAWFHLHRYSKSSNGDFNLKDVINVSDLGDAQRLCIYQNRFEGYSLAAYAACSVAKTCSKLAFKKYGRSMTASDLIPFIQNAFENFEKQ